MTEVSQSACVASKREGFVGGVCTSLRGGHKLPRLLLKRRQKIGVSTSGGVDVPLDPTMLFSTLMLNRLPAGIGFASAINERNFDLVPPSCMIGLLAGGGSVKVGSHPNQYKRKATWKDKSTGRNRSNCRAFCSFPTAASNNNKSEDDGRTIPGVKSKDP